MERSRSSRFEGLFAHAIRSGTDCLLPASLLVATTDLLSISIDLGFERSGKVLVDGVRRGGKVLQDDLNSSELSVVKRGVVAVANTVRVQTQRFPRRRCKSALALTCQTLSLREPNRWSSTMLRNHASRSSTLHPPRSTMVPPHPFATLQSQKRS